MELEFNILVNSDCSKPYKFILEEAVYVDIILCRTPGVIFFFLSGHFWGWGESYFSSSIATKGFGGAVSSIFDAAFTRSFPHFSFKEVLDLQKINLFTLILFSFFFPENTVIHCHLVPNNLEIQSRTRFTFLQNQYSERLHNVIAHIHYKITL